MYCNSIMLNVFTNCVYNKVIEIHDKDPPCMTESIELKIQWRNSIYKSFHNSF